MKKYDGYNKLVASILCLGILTGVGSACSKVENVSYDKKSITNIDTKSLYRQMYNNTSISNEEAFELVKKVIYDYGYYMDNDSLIKMSESLDINYEYLGRGVSGYYKKSSNEIVINMSMANYNDSTLFHEMIHFLSKTGFQKEINSGSKKYYIGKGINDGMTQEIVNEYYDRDSGVYSKEVALNNAVMEIIGKDTMLEAYFSNDLDKLIDKMERYIPRGDAETLIQCIDGVSTFNTRYKSSGLKSDYDGYKECAELSWVLIENMYNNKYGIDMDKNSIMMAYKTISLDNNYTKENDSYRVVVDKNYFVEDNDPKIIYYTKGRIVDGKYTNSKIVKLKKRSN